MEFHNVIRVMTNVSTTNFPTVSSDTHEPRYYNRNSQFLFEFSANPGATSGKMVLEAKMSSDLEYCEVHEYGGSRVELDLSNVTPPSYNIMAAGVQLFYSQRWTSESGSTGNTRNMNAWIIE